MNKGIRPAYHEERRLFGCYINQLSYHINGVIALTYCHYRDGEQLRYHSIIVTRFTTHYAV